MLHIRFYLILMVLAGASLSSAQPYKLKIESSDEVYAASGDNATVVHVESPSAGSDGKTSSYHYAPQVDNPRYGHLQFHIDPSAKPSKHGDAVGQLLYGQPRSVAVGIEHVYVFSSFKWLRDLAHWDLKPSTGRTLFPGPTVIHSWVTGSAHERFDNLLKRADASAWSNNVLHVTGVRKQGVGQPLMSGGYNSISVGSAHQNIDIPYLELSESYGSQRYRPHVVVPFPHSSAAVPVVAAAAVRINALAQKKGIKINHGRANRTLLPVELTKALLMASSTPNFEFTYKGEMLRSSFGAFGITESGMDKRYGMGMLNVAAAEQLVQGYGQHFSPTDEIITRSGFWYVAQPQSEQQLLIESGHQTDISITLSWLAQVDLDESAKVNLTLHDWNLCLVKETDQGDVIVAYSSAATDSVENIRTVLDADTRYRMIVHSGLSDVQDAAPFALAWHLSQAK